MINVDKSTDCKLINTIVKFGIEKYKHNKDILEVVFEVQHFVHAARVKSLL